MSPYSPTNLPRWTKRACRFSFFPLFVGASPIEDSSESEATKVSNCQDRMRTIFPLFEFAFKITALLAKDDVKRVLQYCFESLVICCALYHD